LRKTLLILAALGVAVLNSGCALIQTALAVGAAYGLSKIAK
jgi:hypothetical protein